MKKLIPAALLLAAVGAAQAQVSVYGLIDLSYGKNVVDDATGTRATIHSGGDDGSSQGNSTTRVGLKGSTEVSPGLKANFKLESAGITSEGAVGSAGQPFFNRQTWAGLSGAFGEVRLGKQDSVPFQTMIDFDLNGAANAASAFGNIAAAPWLRGRQARSLQYIAPEMSGIKAQFGLAPAGTAAGEKTSVSAGVTYTAGPLVVAAAVETKRADTDKNFMSLAGRYDLGVAKVSASYSNGGTDLRGIGLGVVAPIAGFNIGLQFGRNTDTKATAVEVFANREIFKNTYGYVDLGSVSKTTTTSIKGKAYAAGVIYVF